MPTRLWAWGSELSQVCTVSAQRTLVTVEGRKVTQGHLRAQGAAAGSSGPYVQDRVVGGATGKGPVGQAQKWEGAVSGDG